MGATESKKQEKKPADGSTNNKKPQKKAQLKRDPTIHALTGPSALVLQSLETGDMVFFEDPHSARVNFLNLVCFFFFFKRCFSLHFQRKENFFISFLNFFEIKKTTKLYLIII